jgi:hypothetical protein
MVTLFCFFLSGLTVSGEEMGDLTVVGGGGASSCCCCSKRVNMRVSII